MNRIVFNSLFMFSAAGLLVAGTTGPAAAGAQQGQQGYALQQDQGGQNGQGDQGGQGGQGRQGRQRGQGGQGGFGGGPGGGRGGFGQFGGMMGNRPLSAANVSLRLMATYLGLNDSQIGKIALSRDDMQESFRMAPPRRGENQDFQAMISEMNARRDSAEKKSVAEIKAVLTPEQTTKLATLIRAMEQMQTAGFRPDAIGALKLTDEQITRVSRGGPLSSILTPEQMTLAETYRVPAPGQGGPGGFRGPGRPGGPGGPGGPGQGAPPPPNQGI